MSHMSKNENPRLIWSTLSRICMNLRYVLLTVLLVMPSVGPAAMSDRAAKMLIVSSPLYLVLTQGVGVLYVCHSGLWTSKLGKH